MADQSRNAVAAPGDARGVLVYEIFKTFITG